MTTKNKSKTKSRTKESDQLKPEYHFDYAEAKPNRFSARIRKGSVAVLLEPDVAKLFKDAKSVNAVLRALISTMPARPASAR
jgi:hypothetical protein